MINTSGSETYLPMINLLAAPWWLLLFWLIFLAKDPQGVRSYRAMLAALRRLRQGRRPNFPSHN